MPLSSWYTELISRHVEGTVYYSIHSGALLWVSYSCLRRMNLCPFNFTSDFQMANEARPCPCDIGDKFEYGGLGYEVQVEHIKAYVCKPSTSTERAVIVIQDIFGWQLPNTRYMVDMLAANGYM